MLRSASRVIAVRRFSSAAAAPSSGPPFKRYFLYTTAIMFGVPGAIGATFVYNLRSDDAFYSHFNARYPELIAAINERFPLDPQSAVDFASRTDIGPITPPSELQDETVTVVVDLASGVRVRFQVKGDASEEEIAKAALSHSRTMDDRVAAITIDEDAVGTESGSVVVEFVGNAFGKAPSSPAQRFAGPPPSTPAAASSRQGVGWKRTPTPAEKPESEVRAEIEALRVQQMALEESKFAGRDVDEADDEIRVLEARKSELKALLPRKRFLYIF
ncbi:hypothetical protein PybrP1_010098 [[Pythium] brassicae (nom. inval.)]|nr:hypothetical protein PybrP1_010098 [[Pythium] brassicae (nom. inval.)]